MEEEVEEEEDIIGNLSNMYNVHVHVTTFFKILHSNPMLSHSITTRSDCVLMCTCVYKQERRARRTTWRM